MPLLLIWNKTDPCAQASIARFYGFSFHLLIWYQSWGCFLDVYSFTKQFDIYEFSFSHVFVAKKCMFMIMKCTRNVYIHKLKKKKDSEQTCWTIICRFLVNLCVGCGNHLFFEISHQALFCSFVIRFYLVFPSWKIHKAENRS